MTTTAVADNVDNDNDDNDDNDDNNNDNDDDDYNAVMQKKNLSPRPRKIKFTIFLYSRFLGN